MKKTNFDPPKSAMALYVKIYCQKQSSTKNRQYSLMEATKSWVSLSESDKQYFSSVFQEYKTKMRKNFASNLQKAQPYLKKKQGDPKRLSKTSIKTINHSLGISEDEDIHKENNYSISYNKEIEIENGDKQMENNNSSTNLENVACKSMESDKLGSITEPSPPMRMENNTSTNLENVACKSMESDKLRSISEPSPPMSSSMELFEMIKHNEESTQNLNWTDLTKTQKQRYQRALLSIKREYIKQYTMYLEQLTAEQLFTYYKSKS